MINYICAGTLPDVWKDVVPEDDSYPKFTITSNGDSIYIFENGKIESEHYIIDDDWIDYYITERSITEEKIREIIAKIINIDKTNIQILFSEVPYNYSVSISDEIIKKNLDEAGKAMNEFMDSKYE